MTNLPPTDVVIVGGGWTGLLLAKELGARTAVKVIVLERGIARRAGDYYDGMDELDYSIRLRMMQDVAKETVTFRNNGNGRALPIRQFGSFLPGSGVGGAGEHWNGISCRFLPDVFDIRTRTVERYGKSKLPALSQVQDWGVTYQELEPYYGKAERLLGISGAPNAKEGPRSGPYPTPPQKTAYFTSLFNDATRKAGYHPAPIPSANLSQAYKNPDGIIRPACQYCGFCDRFGCMVSAKAQPTNTLMPVIARQKNVAVKAGATVRRVIHRDGRATGVVYVDDKGEEYFQPADLVVLASWTLNNTRLLLLSKIGEPYDPATGKGLVGRSLTHQTNSRGPIMFFNTNFNRYMGSGASGAAIRDLDGDNFDHADLDFIRGAYILSRDVGFRPIANFGVVPPSVKSNWGSEWKKAAIEEYDKTAAFGITGEHLAYSTNWMDLDPTYKDWLGDPLLRMTLDWHDNDRKMIAYVTAKMIEVAKAMGAREIIPTGLAAHYDVIGYKSTHVQGGTIMGASPESSVLNPWLQHWQMSNLFVLGASSFPQNASANPTLTILAQTLRTSDAMVDRYLKRPMSLA